MGVWSDEKYDFAENDSEKIDYIYRRLKGQRVAGWFETGWKWMVRISILWAMFQLYTNPMGFVKQFTGGMIGGNAAPSATHGLDAASILRMLGGNANPLGSWQVPTDLPMRAPGSMFSPDAAKLVSPGSAGLVDEEHDYLPTNGNAGAAESPGSPPPQPVRHKVPTTR